VNILTDLAKYDIVSFLQSDMIVSKDYDLNVLEDLEENCILSATRTEPPLHPPSPITFTRDFGITPDKFDWDGYMEFATTVKSDRTEEYFFAPFTYHKKTWQSVGGHDSIFRRSREDSDILQKFMHSGIKIKQTFKANVYHFTCVSSRGTDWFDTNNTQAQERVKLQEQADGFEMRKFIRKWGTFSHNTPLTKYDVSLRILNCDKMDWSLIQNLEPYFTKVWLDSQFHDGAINSTQLMEDTIPNQLLDISMEGWNASRRFYNTTNYFNIFFSGPYFEYNALVTIDATNCNWKSLFELVGSLAGVVETYEIGEYEYDNIKIEIERKVKISDKHLITQHTELSSGLIIEE